MTTEHQDKISVRGYVVGFGAVFLALTLVIAVVRIFFFPDTSVAGVSFISPFICATFIAMKFVEGEKRAPTKAERRKLTMGSIAVTFLLQVVFAGIAAGILAMMDPGALSRRAWSAAMGVAVFYLIALFLVNYLLMRWAYGRFAQKQAARVQSTSAALD